MGPVAGRMETSRCNASEIRSPVAANRLISAAYVLGNKESDEESLEAARIRLAISSRE